MTGPTISVDGLRVSAGETELIHRISFDVAAGERLAIVGESGSGKSLTAKAILGLLPPGLSVTGQVRVRGIDPFRANRDELRRLRGPVLGAVFQDPRSSLNPLVRVGAQITEPLRRQGWSRSRARQRAIEVLASMRFDDPEQTLSRFPLTLSGGQRQRVAIAVAAVSRPAALIADEPTSALDVSVQSEVVTLLSEIVGDGALVFITHDLALGSQLCERTIVLDGGEIVAAGPTSQVLGRPQHDSAAALVAATRALELPWDLSVTR
ncbi:MAG: ABC transporter ATP-binding protein [Actinomycetales bacterium]|nr:MAG: ABC transporter ATP-binding protein [Actinomycetales bacterium]